MTYRHLPDELIFVKLNREPCMVPDIRRPYTVLKARAMMGANGHGGGLFTSGCDTLNNGNPVDSIPNFI